MFLIYRVLIILFVFLLGGLGVQAQEIVAPADSLAQTDSLLVAPTDSTTLAGDSIPEKQTGLDAPVSYQATDSIVMGISLRGRRCQIPEYRAAIRIDRDEYG